MTQEPKCGKIKPFAPLKIKHYDHSWVTSRINGLETGYCSMCGTVRMRPYMQDGYNATVSAMAYFTYHYYKPSK